MSIQNFSVLKLQHLAEVTISTSVLRSVNLEHILYSDFDEASSQILARSLDETITPPYKEKEVLFINDLASNVYQLKLPEFLLNECFELIRSIGMETIKYFQNLPINSLWMTFPYKPQIYFSTIEWSQKGLVDELSMARNVLSRPYKYPAILFELACNYCLEDLVTQFWLPNIVAKPNFKRFSLSQTTYKPFTDYNFALHYWNQFMLQKLDVFEKALVKNLPGRSLNEIMCLWSLGQSNSFAFEYFWSKINQNDKERLILQFFKDSIRHKINPQTIFLLFSSLTEEQVASVANDSLFYQNLLQITLSFPWLDHFSTLFELCRVSIPENHYERLLLDLSNKVTFGIYSSTYRSLFQLVWISLPSQMKVSLLPNYYHLEFPLFWKIFEDGDIAVIEIILKDCDDSTLRSIFFSEDSLRKMRNLLICKNVNPKLVLNILKNIFNNEDTLQDYRRLLLMNIISTANKNCSRYGKLNIRELDEIFNTFATCSDNVLIAAFKSELVKNYPLSIFEVTVGYMTEYSLESLDESLMWFFSIEEDYVNFKAGILRDKLVAQNLCKKMVIKRQHKFIKLFLKWLNVPIKEFNKDFMLSQAGLEFIYSLGNDKQLSGTIEFFLSEKNLLFEFTNRFQEEFSWDCWHKDCFKNVWRILESKLSKMK